MAAMLGMRKQVTGAELLRRHNEMVEARRLQLAAEPETVDGKREQVAKGRAALDQHAKRVFDTESRRQKRLTKKEALATKNQLGMGNAFNRMLVESLALMLASPAGDFTWQDLCAACFRADPVEFGLVGYPQWPDASKVKTRLAAGKHLMNYKLIEHSRYGFHRLTAAGIARAEKLLILQKAQTP